MKNFCIAALLVFCCSFTLLAQRPAGIMGRVISATDTSALLGATVKLLNSTDSSMVSGQVTDIEGRFRFTNIKEGNYLIQVSYIGYQDFTQKITFDGSPTRLGKIRLQEGKLLQTVEISKKLPPATQNGDTTEMSASSVKTHKDANAEDLVTKMPGVTIQNGQVQAQGEAVKEVLVDGKPFFGNDPTTVLRNLPAEMIDKVQVFDRQSEQSQFTGFNDGNTSKTINIVTRGDMRNAKFGKVYAGYGDQDRFSAGGNLNIFKGDKRISVLALSNNINEQNFSIDDLVGATGGGGQGGMGRMGGGGMGGGRPRMGGGGQGGGGGGNGTDISDFQVTQRNGISTSYAVGINYSDKWGKDTEVSGSYFFNLSKNDANSSLLREYVLPSVAGQQYDESSISYNRNINHKFNLRLNHNIDSSNSILIRPRLTLQTNGGNNFLLGTTTIENQMLNNTRNDFKTDLTGVNFANELLFRHKFAKAGRTISLGWNAGYTQNKGESYLNTASNYFETDTLRTALNQFSDLEQNGWSNSGTVSYTEPLSTKNFLQATYTISHRPNDSDKLTAQYDNASSAYSRIDTALSNRFKSQYITQSGALDYRFQSEKIQFNAGVSAQRADLRNQQAFPAQYNINRTFDNLLPNAMLRYTFSKRSNLRFMYRTSTNAPAVSQLQDVVNNTNPLQLSTGNSALKQEYQHNIFTRYMSSSVSHSHTIFGMIGGTFKQNHIANGTYIAQKDTVINESVTLQRGAQITSPVNLSGYYSLRSFFMYGFPMAAIKSNLNLTASATYTRTPGSINGAINYSKSPNLSFGLVLSSNISEKIDFTVSSQSNLVKVENTLQKQLNSQYLNQTSRVKATITFGANWVFQTDLNHQYYTGLSEGFNQNFWLWNASFGKKFMKDQRGELKLSVFDLLKQNNSIQRNITETYYEDTRTTVLQRYFMLTFTYKIRSFAKKPEETKS
jgi:hypothetical protein